jgi:hypothetical protein
MVHLFVVIAVSLSAQYSQAGFFSDLLEQIMKARETRVEQPVQESLSSSSAGVQDILLTSNYQNMLAFDRAEIMHTFINLKDAKGKNVGISVGTGLDPRVRIRGFSSPSNVRARDYKSREIIENQAMTSKMISKSVACKVRQQATTDRKSVCHMGVYGIDGVCHNHAERGLAAADESQGRFFEKIPGPTGLLSFTVYGKFGRKGMKDCAEHAVKVCGS